MHICIIEKCSVIIEKCLVVQDSAGPHLEQGSPLALSKPDKWRQKPWLHQAMTLRKRWQSCYLWPCAWTSAGQSP